jgi:hypothetical protein
MTPLAHEPAGRGIGHPTLEGLTFSVKIRRPVGRQAISTLLIAVKFGGHFHDANTLENFVATQLQKIKLARTYRADGGTRDSSETVR